MKDKSDVSTSFPIMTKVLRQLFSIMCVQHKTCSSSGGSSCCCFSPNDAHESPFAGGWKRGKTRTRGSIKVAAELLTTCASSFDDFVSIQLTWGRAVPRIGSSCQHRHHTNICLRNTLRQKFKSYYRLISTCNYKNQRVNVPATKRRLTNDVR